MAFNYDNNMNINNNNFHNIINNLNIYELLDNGTPALLDYKINKLMDEIDNIHDNNNNNNNNNIVDNYEYAAENNYSKLVIIMALVDKRYHINESVLEYNHRLRNSIQNNFNKDISNNKKEYFRIWEDNIEDLPNNTSRLELFSFAPVEALIIVGI